MNIGLICQGRLGDPAKAAAAYREYLRLGGDDPRVGEWLKAIR